MGQAGYKIKDLPGIIIRNILGIIKIKFLNWYYLKSLFIILYIGMEPKSSK